MQTLSFQILEYHLRVHIGKAAIRNTIEQSRFPRTRRSILHSTGTNDFGNAVYRISFIKMMCVQAKHPYILSIYFHCAPYLWFTLYYNVFVFNIPYSQKRIIHLVA